MKIINTRNTHWQEEYVLSEPFEQAGADIVLDFDQGKAEALFPLGMTEETVRSLASEHLHQPEVSLNPEGRVLLTYTLG